MAGCGVISVWPLLSHRLLQMLWPMLMWVTESERDQLWSVYPLGSVTFKPAGNIFIWRWFIYLFISWLSFAKKKKHDKAFRQENVLSIKQLFFFGPIDYAFENKLFHQQDFFLSESKLCTFIPDLFNGWVEPKTYTGKLKSLPSLSDIYGRDRSP